MYYSYWSCTKPWYAYESSIYPKLCVPIPWPWTNPAKIILWRLARGGIYYLVSSGMRTN
jgi:hypothetical protein